MKFSFNITLFFFYLAASLIAQTGPGGIGANNGSSALKIWLDASQGVFSDRQGTIPAAGGSRIAFWRDRSGTAIHAFTDTASQRPELHSSSPHFNGQPAIRFRSMLDSTNEKNSLLTTSFPVSADMSIYCVFHPLAKGGGTNNPVIGPFSQDHWYFGAGIVDADMNFIQNDIGMSLTDTSLAGGIGSPGSGIDYTIKVPLGINKTTIATLIRTSASRMMDIIANGQMKNTAYTAFGDPVSSAPRFAIGSTLHKTNGYFNHLDGYISSVIIFSKSLSLAEQIILENYLSARYNTVLSPGHDYYKMDEPANGNFDAEVAGIGQANDGSRHSDSQGEGNLRISNPDNLDNDEFLFWGHSGVPLSEMEKTDTPAGLEKRFKRIWKASEVNEVGKVTVSAYLPGLGAKASAVALIIDRNGNGVFSDEPATSLLYAGSLVSTDTYVFSGVDFSDGMLFTFGAEPSVFTGGEVNPVLTPNGDKHNDVFLIEEKEKVTIFDRHGKLVKELYCPCAWDGTDKDGNLSTTGLYLLRTESGKITTLTLIR